MIRARKILVLEDCDEDYETVLDAALQAGVTHEFCRARSGEECVGWLLATNTTPHALPMLILLDLNTPKDDGRHALSAIKLNAGLRAIPLVVLSTSSNPRDMAFCYANGANSYHVKPVNHASHLQVVQSLLVYWLTSAVLSD